MTAIALAPLIRFSWCLHKNWSFRPHMFLIDAKKARINWPFWWKICSNRTAPKKTKQELLAFYFITVAAISYHLTPYFPKLKSKTVCANLVRHCGIETMRNGKKIFPWFLFHFNSQTKYSILWNQFNANGLNEPRHSFTNEGILHQQTVRNEWNLYFLWWCCLAFHCFEQKKRSNASFSWKECSMMK